MFSVRRVSAVWVALALAACSQSGGDETDAGTPPDSGGNPPPATGGTPPGPLPTSDVDVFRFSQQATFGASSTDLDTIQTTGYEAWIVDQIDEPIETYTNRLIDADEVRFVNVNIAQALFWERAIHGDDQLRQRVAYALSQIVVVSLTDPQLKNRTREFGVYLDLLQEHALGNYCELVRDVTFTPTMGLFLTHLGNRKADPVTGFVPDENYAREVMQLFTIGLEELNDQGQGQGRETYSIDDVSGLAAVFTGLSWADTNFQRPSVSDDNRFLPMESYAAHHEDQPKSFLGVTVDFGTDAVAGVNAALDRILGDPNVAPFISKQLIQKLVTSNPSPGYVGRVASAFEAGTYTMPDGQTVGAAQRCDLAATVAAILLDPEARTVPTDPNAGKYRSPVLSLAQFLRAFRIDQEVSRSGDVPAARALDGLEDGKRFGVNAFVSPSVFNFYRPGFVAAGTESAVAGLVTPEFQIATAPSLVGYINTMEDFIDGPLLDSSRPNVAEISYGDLASLASDPTLLVSTLADLLTGGTLSGANQQAIIDAVSAVNISTNNQERDQRRRLELALVMIIASPEYVVQR